MKEVSKTHFRPSLNVLLLSQSTILEQLQLEEALLRADQRNWCLINPNPPEAIVMGISSSPEKVIDLDRLQKQPVPLIRRFSGGGTVFIDADSIIKTFIFNQADLGIPCYPHAVFQWSEIFYRLVFQEIELRLCENDYVIKGRKCGGNAQYMTKNRWLHHTSFLWDYQAENMAYLKMPPKMPGYRERRSHDNFLCKLGEYLPSKQEVVNRFLKTLKVYFKVEISSLSEAYKVTQIPHRRTSQRIDLF